MPSSVRDTCITVFDSYMYVTLYYSISFKKFGTKRMLIFEACSVYRSKINILVRACCSRLQGDTLMTFAEN